MRWTSTLGRRFAGALCLLAVTRHVSISRELFRPVETVVKVVANDYRIPAILWQTWFTSDLMPSAARQVAEMKRLNP